MKAVNGALASEESRIPFTKNCTFCTVPSLSVALTAIVCALPTTRELPEVGEEIAMMGALFGTTVMRAGLETVVVLPFRATA